MTQGWGRVPAPRPAAATACEVVPCPVTHGLHAPAPGGLRFSAESTPWTRLSESASCLQTHASHCLLTAPLGCGLCLSHDTSGSELGLAPQACASPVSVDGTAVSPAAGDKTLRVVLESPPLSSPPALACNRPVVRLQSRPEPAGLSLSPGHHCVLATTTSPSPLPRHTAKMLP